jgi:hypothetical protein
MSITISEMVEKEQHQIEDALKRTQTLKHFEGLSEGSATQQKVKY